MTTFDIIVPLLALGMGVALIAAARISAKRVDRIRKQHPAE